MSRRCRVEDHVVKAVRQLAPCQQLGELVECGDLGRAGAGELLFHRLDGLVRHGVAHRPDDPIAIRLPRPRGRCRGRRGGHLVYGGRLCSPTSMPKTCPRFDAGSVLTSSTRFPRSARPTATAQASEVFPTPPLPVKNRFRVAGSGRIMANPLLGTPTRRAGRRRPGSHHRRRRAARGGRFSRRSRHHPPRGSTGHSGPVAVQEIVGLEARQDTTTAVDRAIGGTGDSTAQSEIGANHPRVRLQTAAHGEHQGNLDEYAHHGGQRRSRLGPEEGDGGCHGQLEEVARSDERTGSGHRFDRKPQDMQEHWSSELT